MPHSKKVIGYREYLERLSYPEYATNHVSDARQNTVGHQLNLSLWSDDLPPGVAEAVSGTLPNVVGMYQLAQDSTLLSLLASRLKASADSIMITAGADDALRIAAQYCIRPGTRVLIPTPCFGRNAYHAMIQEAKIFYIDFNTYPYELDITKIIEEISRQRAQCLFLASPNNPTGHAIGQAAIKQLLDAVSCPVILDESLLLATHSRSSVELVETYQDLFICGSFSKLYGLAGLRTGYLVTNPIHRARLAKLISPFGVDALGLEIAKHMIAQDEWLRSRILEITSSVAILHTVRNPVLRVTRTSAPVGLIEYTGRRGSLYKMLRTRGVNTVASTEFPGLSRTNAVRVIIKNINEMLELKKILADIS